MKRPCATFHRPVMVNEVIDYLRPRTGTVIDATVGGGGHAREILGVFTEGLLLGIDIDPEAIRFARTHLADFENVKLVQASYVEMASVVQRLGLGPVTGVLMDLGVSLHQLSSQHRGFSFVLDGPIDMRYDQTSSRPSALAFIRRATEPQIRNWLRDYGQEPFAAWVARRIGEHRRGLETTGQLASLVRSAVPTRRARKTLARVFQTFRLLANCELDNVRAGVRAALGLLAVGGRLVVLAYHSLEDRIVKEELRFAAQQGRLRILTRKPVRPGPEEVDVNPQSRSARLRAGELGPPHWGGA